jgi:thiol-disulfide isomerase/thioredoxin
MRHVKRMGWMLAGVAAGAAAGVLLWFSPDAATPPTHPPAPGTTPITPAPAPVVGSLPPDFTLAGLDGEETSLSDLRGKAVILNFWATWCTPCHAELPLLDRIAHENSEAVAVLAVASEEGEAEIRGFTDDLTLTTIRLLADPAGRIRNDYLVRGLPTSFFLDSTGVIRHIKVGTMEYAEIEDILRQIGALP